MKNRIAEYTKEIHAVRLIEMFKLMEECEICHSCPASLYYRAGTRFIFEKKFNIHQNTLKTPECIVCKAFLDMPDDTEACPCDHFDTPEEAVEVTKVKLRKAGYDIT